MRAVLAWAVAGLVAGSVPPAVVVGRLWGVDVLAEGSRNPGASNVRRLAGMAPAVVTFFLDFGVGILAPLVPRWAGAPLDAAVACAVGAVVGRAFSPWLGWRGGRAQSLILASAIVLVPKAAVGVLAVYATGAALRELSVAGLLNMFVLPALCVLFYGGLWAVAYGTSVAFVALVRRLQGSPDGRPYSRWQRVVFDRERRPAPAT